MNDPRDEPMSYADWLHAAIAWLDKPDMRNSVVCHMEAAAGHITELEAQNADLRDKMAEMAVYAVEQGRVVAALQAENERLKEALGKIEVEAPSLRWAQQVARAAGREK